MHSSFQAEVCSHCNLRTTHARAMSKGTVKILIKFVKAVTSKGINILHPGKEGHFTHIEQCQFMTLRAHALLTKIQNHVGNWGITTKGIQFLQGLSIPRIAIVDKYSKNTIGYWNETEDNISIHSFSIDDPNWEGVNFEIIEGKIVKTIN